MPGFGGYSDTRIICIDCVGFIIRDLEGIRKYYVVKEHGQVPITGEVVQAIANAIKDHGNQRNFSSVCGIQQATLSRYLNGAIQNLNSKSYCKLYPYIKEYLSDPVSYTKMKDDMRESGSALKSARNISGLSQAELSELSGISQENISRIERGVWGPDEVVNHLITVVERHMEETA